MTPTPVSPVRSYPTPVPVLQITGARSALITPTQARDRAGRMPNAEVAIVPGSHGGFNRISELNDRIAIGVLGGYTGPAITQGRDIRPKFPQNYRDPVTCQPPSGAPSILTLRQTAASLPCC